MYNYKNIKKTSFLDKKEPTSFSPNKFHRFSPFWLGRPIYGLVKETFSNRKKKKELFLLLLSNTETVGWFLTSTRLFVCRRYPKVNNQRIIKGTMMEDIRRRNSSFFSKPICFGYLPSIDVFPRGVNGGTDERRSSTTDKSTNASFEILFVFMFLTGRHTHTHTRNCLFDLTAGWASSFSRKTK